MNRIAEAFEELKKKGEKALIPFITAGDPDLETTLELVRALVEAGADIIELGIPFSDPLADGPTIQRASQRALASGTTLDKVFEMVRELREKNTDVPIVFLTYYNPIFRYGIERFVKECAEAGVDGLIVPDLPPEEAADLAAAAEKYGVDLIFLVAPTSTDERIKMIAKHASGFVYCVSVTGVTGARSEIAADLAELVSRIRKHTDLPIAVGFGISTPEQAAEVAQVADGVIVGSAIVKRIEENQDEEDIVEEVREFVRELREAVKLEHHHHHH
uniref:LBCATS-a n=1 Tax=synthetic construct TaxID=32630 RepID=UPI0007B176CF|nr:Chain A, LBCATS-a [synthetic construct]5EY5_C Chain C, LBCATS-a [synthetic construct]